MADDRKVGMILWSFVSLAVASIFIAFILTPYMGQLPFGEGDFVILKPGIEEAMTYHVPCSTEIERYPLKQGMIVQVRSEPGTNYWFYSTQVLPRCSNCRISHEQQGDAWVDCALLIRVEMQKEEQ